MPNPVSILINAVDQTLNIPFSTSADGVESLISITETVPGSATAHLRIVDETNSISVPGLAPVLIVDNVNVRNIFQGLTQKPKFTIRANYRIIDVDCIDLNALLDTHLVGTPDGTNWEEDPVTGLWTCADPNAQIFAGSDAANVAALFAAYWKYPVAIDTTTYVDTLNPSVGDPPTYWDRVTLRQALDDVAAVSSPQVYYWIDADAKLHWTNRPQTGAPSGGGGGGGVTGNLLMLFPQRTNADPPSAPAPYALSDSPDGVTSIGYEAFEYAPDYSGFAYSLYASGGTGFTYQPAVPPPVTPGQYIATFSQATRIYAVHATGYIAEPGTIYGSPGLQHYVNPKVIKIDPVHGTGGHFWMIKTSTPTVYPAGWLISQHDKNVSVVPVRTTTTPAAIGIGGTGWVAGGAPSWLSRYIDLPDAQSQTQRDNLGGTALAASNVPVIRGACEITWLSALFRAGMALTITNVPVGLAGALFTLLRVTTTFLSGTDLRHAVLEWGNAPLGSLGLRRQAARKPTQRKGATAHLLRVSNVQPPAGGTVLISAQLVNEAGEPWAVAGKAVDWSVVVKNSAGTDVTATTAYVFNPDASVTDAKGQASTQLTVDTVLGLSYTIIAASPD